MLVIGYWFFKNFLTYKHFRRHISFSRSAFGYWLFAVGYWLFAIGYWLFAVGYWLFEI